jgi:hypothetical protein
LSHTCGGWRINESAKQIENPNRLCANRVQRKPLIRRQRRRAVIHPAQHSVKEMQIKTNFHYKTMRSVRSASFKNICVASGRTSVPKFSQKPRYVSMQIVMLAATNMRHDTPDIISPLSSVQGTTRIRAGQGVKQEPIRCGFIRVERNCSSGTNENINTSRL